MTGPQWFLLACFLVLAVSSRYRISQAFPRGADSLAASRGNAARAVLYSLTKAMLPWKKETAHRHPASYVLGVGYHAGVFLSFAWLILIFLGVSLPPLVDSISVALLGLAGLCGLALLIKRITTAKMRYFSNPDDYFSNILVTGFLALNAVSILYSPMIPVFFVYSGILFLYIPLGKLRHAIYFVTTRIYLGLFYGRRGVWPLRR